MTQSEYRMAQHLADSIRGCSCDYIAIRWVRLSTGQVLGAEVVHAGPGCPVVLEANVMHDVPRHLPVTYVELDQAGDTAATDQEEP